MLLVVNTVQLSQPYLDRKVDLWVSMGVDRGEISMIRY